MKRYKVLKDFLDDKAILHLKGNEFESVAEDYANRLHFWEMLKANNFIKEIPQQPKTVWDLKEGNTFYLISGDGFITTETYKLDTQYDDEMRIAIGNTFLTREDAEKELARRKAKQILLRDTKGFKPDWQDEQQPKHEVSYNCITDDLRVSKQYVWCYGTILFATEEDAKASIKTHGKEWKIYLGVEG